MRPNKRHPPPWTKKYTGQGGAVGIRDVGTNDEVDEEEEDDDEDGDFGSIGDLTVATEAALGATGM